MNRDRPGFQLMRLREGQGWQVGHNNRALDKSGEQEAEKHAITSEAAGSCLAQWHTASHPDLPPVQISRLDASQLNASCSHQGVDSPACRQLPKAPFEQQPVLPHLGSISTSGPPPLRTPVLLLARLRNGASLQVNPVQLGWCVQRFATSWRTQGCGVAKSCGQNGHACGMCAGRQAGGQAYIHTGRCRGVIGKAAVQVQMLLICACWPTALQALTRMLYQLNQPLPHNLYCPNNSAVVGPQAVWAEFAGEVVSTQ